MDLWETERQTDRQTDYQLSMEKRYDVFYLCDKFGEDGSTIRDRK